MGGASAKGIADYLVHERSHVASNMSEIALRFGRDPDKRAEAMSEVARGHAGRAMAKSELYQLNAILAYGGLPLVEMP